jgi:hypothetical protein
MKTLYFVLSVFLLLFYTTSCNKLVKTRVAVSVIAYNSYVPIEGAEVVLLEGDPGGVFGTLPNWSVRESGYTDKDGICLFEFRAKPGASYTLKARHEDYYDEPSGGSGSKTVHPRKRNFVSFFFPPNAWIKVHTVNVNKEYEGISVGSFGTPGGGGRFFGENVDTFTIAKSFGNWEKFVFYQLWKNGKMYEHQTPTFRTGAHDTTYVLIAY